MNAFQLSTLSGEIGIIRKWSDIENEWMVVAQENVKENLNHVIYEFILHV